LLGRLSSPTASWLNGHTSPWEMTSLFFPGPALFTNGVVT